MKITSISQPQDGTIASVQDTGDAFDILYRIDVAAWIYDIDRAKIVSANEAACEVWNAETEEELCNRNLESDMSSTVRNRLRQYQTDFLTNDASFTELWTLYPNDSPISVMVIYRGYVLRDGRMGMLCEVVGESKDTPENLRSAEALLHTDVMIMLFSRDGPALYLNPAARNAFAAPLSHLEEIFVVNQDVERLLGELDREGEQRAVTRLHTVNGPRWFDVSAKTCSDAVTGKPALLLTSIDVSDLKEARDTARHLADRDQLTNLHNRSYLQNHLAWLEDCGATNGLTLIMFDIDKFKSINDRHGHDAGDTVLRQVATRVRGVLPPQDLLARFGGDEFVIVISEPVDEADLACQIESVRQAIAKPFQHDQTRLNVSVSIGVSQFKDQTTRAASVMREADIALYASKQSGRDRVTYFNVKMGEAVAARDRLEIELSAAVEREEFVLHYQPRLDVTSGKIVGAEGLVRWHHPSGKTLMPNAFIPICEETGLIDELGRIVLEIGVAQAIKWNKEGRGLSLSLNVSPRQFSDPTFLGTLRNLAAREGFPMGRVELEITESVLIGDNQLIADKLRAITAMGYEIAIDDFGTGYSNLSYISRFPLTCLKIDRSFIDQLPESGPIVQLILTLGKQIGATVVSEGVETQAQLDWLTAHSCEEVQGYLITRALPLDQFETFIGDFTLPGREALTA